MIHLSLQWPLAALDPEELMRFVAVAAFLVFPLLRRVFEKLTSGAQDQNPQQAGASASRAERARKIRAEQARKFEEMFVGGARSEAEEQSWTEVPSASVAPASSSSEVVPRTAKEHRKQREKRRRQAQERTEGSRSSKVGSKTASGRPDRGSVFDENELESRISFAESQEGVSYDEELDADLVELRHLQPPSLGKQAMIDAAVPSEESPLGSLGMGLGEGEDMFHGLGEITESTKSADASKPRGSAAALQRIEAASRGNPWRRAMVLAEVFGSPVAMRKDDGGPAPNH